MSASSRSTSSIRGRITKQPLTLPAAVNAEYRETTDPNTFAAASNDPNIAAATSALIFPQSHNLFESSPHRPRQTSSQRSRSRSSRQQSQNNPSTSSRHTIRRKPVSDREVSDILRNDGFQEQHRSPSATRSSTALSNDFHGSYRSRQSNVSSCNTRQTRSSRQRGTGDEELAGVGEWGEAIPVRSRNDALSSGEEGDANHLQNQQEEPMTPRASSDSANARRSRFVEGTMNDRSMGVASTWYNDGKGREETDAPSASPSKSAPLSQVLSDKNKPLPAVPSPKSSKRRGMFKFGSHKENEGSEEVPSRRKGLRNSKSIFNFRLFNSDAKESKNEPADSQTTATPKTAKRAKISKKKALSEAEAEANILNDRKRKAEEAYAELGFKKRTKHHAEDTANKPPITPSVAKATTATTAHTAFRHRKDQLDTPFAKGPQTNLKGSASSRSLRSAGPTLRKRPSRKDLEEENAKLRSLLALERERINSIAVNGDPLKDHGAKIVEGSVTKFGGLENIPPVPRLPGKGALQLLEGHHLRSRTKAEDVLGELVNDEFAENRGGNGVGVKQSSEWPDDVF